MAKASTVSAATLAKFTQAAVKAATVGIPGKIVPKGPTMGYVLSKELAAADALQLASQITAGVAANARAAGVTGLKPKPVVVRRPGTITVGFIAQELAVPIRG